MSAGEEPPPRAGLVEEPIIEPVERRPLAPAELVEEVDAGVRTEDAEPEAAAGPHRPIETGDVWAKILRAPGTPTVLRTLMTYLRPVMVDVAAGRIVLTGSARHAESARSRLGQIVDVCRRELGRAVEVVIQSEEPEAGSVVETEEETAGGEAVQAAGSSEALVRETPEPGAMQMPGDHPLVKEAMELFGARIVDVQHRRPRE